MRIILAHNNYNILGGAEVFYHEVGRVLIENGHDVAYFSVSAPNVNSEWSGYFPEATNYKDGGLVQKVVGLPKMIYSNDAKDSFVKLIDDFKPDLIHVFAIYIGLTPAILDAGKEKNVPIVMSCNDYKHICPNYKLFHSNRVCDDCKGGRFYKTLTNKCCHNSIAYSVASMAEAYVHGYLDIYRKNVSLFLFASNFMAHKTEDFWGDTFKWGVLKNPFDGKKHLVDGELGNYIVFFGRLIEEKGVDVLLRAADLVPEIKIKIVGNGPDENQLKKLCSSMALENVEFLGPMWGDDLNSILSNCRFVVVPSTWHENYPYVILQSFAARKCVVGSNRGGIPEMLDGKFGWTYEATNPADLAKVITDAYQMPLDQLESRGKEAQEFVVQNFNDSHFYSSLMKNYNRVLS